MNNKSGGLFMKRIFAFLVFAGTALMFFGCSQASSSDTTTSPSDTTATASYTITFNANNGTGTMANQTINSGKSAKLNANVFVFDGYTFAGWATTSIGSVTYADKANYTMGSDNVILYAVWAPATSGLTYWGRWVDTSYGALDSDLTYTGGSDGTITVISKAANLMWSQIDYFSQMPAGRTYKVEFTITTNSNVDFLSVYENDSNQFGRASLAANTPTTIKFNVTPKSGADALGRISFRIFPNLTTGYAPACTYTITKMSIVKL
jgi:uncharacterized repeat protein (TIGR02543 family)